MKKLLLIISFFSVSMLNAEVENIEINLETVTVSCVTNSGYYAATSKSLMNKCVQYSVNKDYDALQKLLDSGLVFSLKGSISVYVVKSSWGLVEIRPKGSTGTVWTNTEAIDC